MTRLKCRVHKAYFTFPVTRSLWKMQMWKYIETLCIIEKAKRLAQDTQDNFKVTFEGLGILHIPIWLSNCIVTSNEYKFFVILHKVTIIIKSTHDARAFKTENGNKCNI